MVEENKTNKCSLFCIAMANGLDDTKHTLKVLQLLFENKCELLNLYNILHDINVEGNTTGNKFAGSPLMLALFLGNEDLIKCVNQMTQEQFNRQKYALQKKPYLLTILYF